MKTKKKQPYKGMSDRFIHDIVNACVVGPENYQKDKCIDAGSAEFGSRHRCHFPHRSVVESAMYMTLMDMAQRKNPDFLLNARLAISHHAVDRLPSRMKSKLSLLKTVSDIFS